MLRTLSLAAHHSLHRYEYAEHFARVRGMPCPQVLPRVGPPAPGGSRHLDLTTCPKPLRLPLGGRGRRREGFGFDMHTREDAPPATDPAGDVPGGRLLHGLGRTTLLALTALLGCAALIALGTTMSVCWMI